MVKTLSEFLGRTKPEPNIEVITRGGSRFTIPAANSQERLDAWLQDGAIVAAKISAASDAAMPNVSAISQAVHRSMVEQNKANNELVREITANLPHVIHARLVENGAFRYSQTSVSSSGISTESSEAIGMANPSRRQASNSNEMPHPPAGSVKILNMDGTPARTPNQAIIPAANGNDRSSQVAEPSGILFGIRKLANDFFSMSASSETRNVAPGTKLHAGGSKINLEFNPHAKVVVPTSAAVPFDDLSFGNTHTDYDGNGGVSTNAAIYGSGMAVSSLVVVESGEHTVISAS